MKLIRIYTTGIFDLFHVGHLRALEKAKSLGDWLLVGVHSDEDAASYKRLPVIPLNERLEILRQVSFVDEVMIAPLETAAKFYEEHQIDIHCQGEDASNYYATGIQRGIMRFVGRDPNIDTTEIIHKIVKRFDTTTPSETK